MTNTHDIDNKPRDSGNESTEITENSTEDIDTGRTARINTDQSGAPIGVAVWLNADELAALGVDHNRTDAVDVRVTDGDLELTPAHRDGDSR
jgi:hypothetical protein